MRNFIIFAILLFCLIYFKEIVAYVKGNLPYVNIELEHMDQNITQWFKDHTPKN